MEVVVGGNRLGSGEKMKGYLKNWERSTHNLSTKFKMSMAPGVLYPIYCRPCARGDKFDIRINADVRTIPTKAPLFGSFKLQIDVFTADIRLYQGLLHNNPINLALKMNQVKLPKLHIEHDFYKNDMLQLLNGNTQPQFAIDSLIYLQGLAGIGTANASQVRAKEETTPITIRREVLALPALSYYDIFKNYYANKQEENAYIISGNKLEQSTITLENVKWRTLGNQPWTYSTNLNVNTAEQLANQILAQYSNTNAATENAIWQSKIQIEYNNGNESDIVTIEELSINTNAYITIRYNAQDNRWEVFLQLPEYYYTWKYKNNTISNILFIDPQVQVQQEEKLKLVAFPLKNIDDMRYTLLANNQLGSQVILNANNTQLPYKALVDQCDNGQSRNVVRMNGLCLKTYQNDMFNNWLNTEWIEGDNGLNEITKVQVVNGKFSMDALNFAKKLYNITSREGVSGGTYEDWLDVNFEKLFHRSIETPIWEGGLSKEIVFDEVVSSAATEEQPLGSLGGRGRASKNQKGGKMHIKVVEPCFLIAIASLTPRIDQTQGNEFYMTDIDSMDDFHKPGMDGIGYQDLLGERMAWFDTDLVETGGTVSNIVRHKIGKLPAWIEYMTDVDRAKGDFADINKAGYMVLSRNYEATDNMYIKDATTYIDPSKYNYAFAYTDIDAQNFWFYCNFDIIAREKISARIIPNV